MLRQDEFAAKFNATLEELEQYAIDGLIFPQKLDDHIAYDDRSILRMHVITRGKAKGLSDHEIKRVIETIVDRE